MSWRGLALALLSGFAVSGVAPGVAAQDARECNWIASARNIAEPWAENTRLFANGAVRLTKIDTVEPALGAYHLMILSPPYNEVGDRQCRIVSWEGGGGFQAIYFSDLTASYDPARGLLFQMPVRIYQPEYDFANSAILSVQLNQATGVILGDLALGYE